MNIQVMSDVHVEFHADRGRAFVSALDPTGVDVLVVAGDLGTLGGGLVAALDGLCDRYPCVVYVTGNHEYYGSERRDVHDVLAGFSASHRNFHVLENGAVVLGGRRFVGTTLWFRDDPGNAAQEGRLADFHEIGRFRNWVYEVNEGATRFLEATIAAQDVVVTHHLPSPESIAPQFRGSPLNRFFVCDLSPLIRRVQPALWIHGHTHATLDYSMERTRVVCNPFGYAGHEENAAFRDRFIIKV